MAELIKILYVDDDKDVREIFSGLFIKEDGYDVKVAESAEEGLTILAEEKQIRLVVADLRLPGMDGVEFLGQVSVQWPDTIRVVLSSYADVAPVVEAVNQGRIYKFIPKPWHADELKATLLRVLKYQDLQRQNARLQKKLQRKSAQLEASNENLEKMVTQRTEALEIRNRVLKISQGVLDVLPVAVFGIDGEGMIVQCNDLACDLFPAGFMGPIGVDRRELFSSALNQLIDRAETGHVASALISLRDRNYRAEIRRLDETIARGLVLVLIPD